MALNAGGTSSFSNIASATTLPAPPTLTAATGSTATTESNGQINLSWNSVTGASGYMLERSLDGTNWQVLTTTGGTSYTDTGLQSDTTYYYRLLVYNSSGSSSFSAPVSAVSSMTSDEHWVLALYQDLLGRNGAKSELDGWVKYIPANGYLFVANGIARSPEALGEIVNSSGVVVGVSPNGFVNKIYVAFLGRSADLPGDENWVSLLQHGETEEQVMSQILGSQEFYAHSGSNNTGFVEALYTDVLKRPADSGGLSGWVSVLNSGQESRTQVASAFLASPEFKRDAVLALYGGAGPAYSFIPNLLERSRRGAGVSPVEINNWVNLMNSGLDLLSMEVDFVGSGPASEFYALAQNS